MKIAFFEIENWEKEFLKNKLKGNQLYFFENELNEKDIKEIEDVDIASIFIYSKITPKTISKLKNLKAVITRSTGFDHIDIKSCKKDNIKVFNVPFYGENTVAEHTFALILALSKNLIPSIDETRRGNFGMNIHNLRGFDLKDKTIGIVGMGHIGEHVARIAKGFEMKVISHSPTKNIKLSKKIGFEYVSFEKLLKESDIVSLHAPYNKKTHHIINTKNIFLMKKGSMLINTARGGLIDTTALIKALDKKHLNAVGLDVLEEESLIKEERQILSKNFPKEAFYNIIENHILFRYPNVIITPHNAFNSIEALQRILDTTCDSIKYILAQSNYKNENRIC